MLAVDTVTRERKESVERTGGGVIVLTLSEGVRSLPVVGCLHIS